MILLILGLALWWVSHLEKIVATGARAGAVARFGEGAWKGVVALATLVAIVLMVIGYQNAAVVDLWYPPIWLWHVNNSLMALAVFVFIAGSFKTPVRRWTRNPQLTGVKLWAFAHLLVNGDLASVVLFGGLLAWAVVAVIGTKRRDGPREEAPAWTAAGLLMHLVAAAVVFGVIVTVHFWLGVPPFVA